MSSKFILAIGRKHLFNPAAFGVLLPALLLDRAGDLVGRRQSAAPARRADRRPAHRPQAPALRSRGNLHPRRSRDGARFGGAGGLRHGARARRFSLSPLFFFAFVMLTEPLTAPDQAPAAPRLRRAGRFPLRPEHPCRLVLFHAGAGAPGRQSLRLCRKSERALRADPASASSNRRRTATTSSSIRRASSPSRPASISNGRSGCRAPTAAATAATSRSPRRRPRMRFASA